VVGRKGKVRERRELGERKDAWEVTEEMLEVAKW